MLLLLTLLACDGAKTAPANAAEATTPELAEVVATTWRPTIELTGSLEPIAAVQLGFDVPGRLSALLVSRGQAVTQGQPLARLDASMASAQAAQADAAVRGAEAQLAAGEASFTRAEALHQAQGLSDQQYQDAKGQIEAARAGVDQARAAARLARTNVGYHTLQSPIAGVVTNGPDNPGMVVGAGTPLFVVADLSALQMKSTAPESAIWLEDGLPATITTGNGRTAAALVSRVLPSLDPQTRRLPVELRVDAPPEGVLAYTFARALITSGTEAPAWSVPHTAVVARPEFVVFAVRDGAPVGSPAKIPVEVVRQDGDNTVVSGALLAGDRVIADPPSTLGEE